jgi:hypothetical protein
MTRGAIPTARAAQLRPVQERHPRHWYPADRTTVCSLATHRAPVLLDPGESIKALAAHLGHTDPWFTLRTYSHPLPCSEDRTRREIDRAFLADQDADDGL